MKVAPVVFGERPVLKMMYAAVLRASDRWRDIKITELELAQLEHLERKLIKTHREANQSAVKKSTSTPNRFYSRSRT